MMSKADEDKVGMESLWLSVGSVNIASHEGFVGGVFWSVVVLIRCLFFLFSLFSPPFQNLYDMREEEEWLVAFYKKEQELREAEEERLYWIQKDKETKATLQMKVQGKKCTVRVQGLNRAIHSHLSTWLCSLSLSLCVCLQKKNGSKQRKRTCNRN